MNQLETFKSIKTFLFDVDGVMTNGDILVLDDGKLLRRMNAKDGLALKMAVKRGFKIGIITGGNSEGVKIRLNNLGIEDIYLSAHDKLSAYENFIQKYKIDPGTILYMGDDLPDVPVLRRVGLPTCPVDAVKEAREIAKYISPYSGGNGCVRDVIEKVLRLQEKWD